jgi:hypothetical protein
MTDGLPKNLPADSVVVPSSDAPFRKIIDSTVMISVARFVMPALLTVAVGGLGWVINDLKAGQREGLAELKASQLAGLNEVKDGQKQVWVQIGKMADSQSASVAIVSGLSVQVANTAQQLTHLQTQFDSLPRGR